MRNHIPKRDFCTHSAALLICSLITVIACEANIPPIEGTSFGLPGKGDLSCDRASHLCWDGADAKAARDLMDTESGVLLGDLPIDALRSSVRALEHKLNDQESNALTELEARLSRVNDNAESAQEVMIYFDRTYGRVISGYWGAHATTLSETLSIDKPTRESKDDLDLDRQSIPPALSVPDRLRPAFEALWAQGAFGQYLVTMLSLTGAATHEPLLIPIQEREVGADSPIDLDAAEITDRFAKYAALESTFANLQGLIPVVGVWVSVPYGIYAQFKLRVRLTLELATLYGLDPTRPEDFLLSMQMMSTAMGFKELFSHFYRALIGAQVYRIYADRGEGQLNEAFSERRITELISANLAQLGVFGAKLLAQTTAKAARGTARALLGQITFGLAALADVTIDYFNTLTIGRELRYMLHPWGWSLYLESARPLNDPEARVCAYSALARIARADEDINHWEAEFVRDALIRPFKLEGALPEGHTPLRELPLNPETRWVMLSSPDTLYQYLDAALEPNDHTPCLSESWGKLESTDQLSLISWLWLMGYADHELNERERDVIESLITRLPVAISESRVVISIRDRVAATPRPHDRPSDALWLWRDVSYDELELVSHEDVTLEIWRQLRQP